MALLSTLHHASRMAIAINIVHRCLIAVVDCLGADSCSGPVQDLKPENFMAIVWSRETSGIRSFRDDDSRARCSDGNAMRDARSKSRKAWNNRTSWACLLPETTADLRHRSETVWAERLPKTASSGETNTCGLLAAVVPTDCLAFHLRSLGRTPTEEELHIITAALELMRRNQVRTDSPLRYVFHDDKANEWNLHFDNGDPNATFTIYLRNKDSDSFSLQHTLIASRRHKYPQFAQELAAQRREAARNIAWKGTEDFKRCVDSFKIKVEEASRIAWRSREKMNRAMSEKSEFIVGRWYWFGLETKMNAPLAGYYVNGDTGKVEYRESKKTIKVGTKRLPKEPWTKITPLPGAGASP